MKLFDFAQCFWDRCFTKKKEKKIIILLCFAKLLKPAQPMTPTQSKIWVTSWLRWLTWVYIVLIINDVQFIYGGCYWHTIVANDILSKLQNNNNALSYISGQFVLYKIFCMSNIVLIVVVEKEVVVRWRRWWQGDHDNVERGGGGRWWYNNWNNWLIL